jgi:predicted acetyltransferase
VVVWDGVVAIEIRVPERAEMGGYYRALPFATGLPQWEPAPSAWHGGPEPWPPPRTPAAAEQLEEWAEADLADGGFHPVAAIVDGKVVGASAMLSFEVTVPGGRLVPMGGVTGTGVIATHRRRGLLRLMMQAMFDAALERGEPLATLSASEGSIYGRFGFSPATYSARWEIRRSEARLLPAESDEGSLELVDAATTRAAWPAVHRAVRAARVGELSPRKGRWDGLTDATSGTDGPLRYLIHRHPSGDVDGIAHFRLPWSTTAEHAGTLIVEALEATTATAYRSMWALLLDFDLTQRIVAPGRPREEPLRWMLANSRALRITRQSDNLWARILDVQRALEGRAYEVPGEITFTIEDDAMCPANVGTWRLAAEGNVSRTAEPADLVIDIQALSSLYLGGMSAYDLAQAGHIRPRADDAVGKLARIFRIDPEPHNSFGF